MQPHEGGRGGPGVPPLDLVDPELAQRLRQAGYGGLWQPGAAFAGQYGAAFGLPYAVAPAFPSQAQLAYLTPAVNRFPGSAQGMPWNQAQRLDSRPASALGQRPTAAVPPAAANPQFAGFYPQASAGYPMQYLPQPGQWRPMPAQQAPPPQGVMPPFAFPAGQPYPQQQGRQPPGRQGGRLPQRGRPNRNPGPNRAQRHGQYRAMWQEVNQVWTLSHCHPPVSVPATSARHTLVMLGCTAILQLAPFLFGLFTLHAVSVNITHFSMMYISHYIPGTQG